MNIIGTVILDVWSILPIPWCCKMLLLIIIGLLILDYIQHRKLKKEVIQPLLYGKDIKFNIPLLNSTNISHAEGLNYFTTAENYKIMGVNYIWLLPTIELEEIVVQFKKLPNNINLLMYNLVKKHQNGDRDGAYDSAVHLRRWLKKNENLFHYIFCTYRTI